MSGHDPKDYGIPTPIDPADIRPGDVVRVAEDYTVTDVVSGVGIYTTNRSFTDQVIPGRTWHLVHRPDPDAEAVEALAKACKPWTVPSYPTLLAALREQGWDVVRAES